MPEDAGGGDEGKLLNGWGVLFWSDGNVLVLDRGGGCTTLWMYSMPLNMFTYKGLILLYKFHLNDFFKKSVFTDFTCNNFQYK